VVDKAKEDSSAEENGSSEKSENDKNINEENYIRWDVGNDYKCVFNREMYEDFSTGILFFKLLLVLWYYLECDSELKEKIMNEMKIFIEEKLESQTLILNILERIGNENKIIKLLRACTQGHFAPCCVAIMNGYAMEEILYNQEHDVLILINPNNCSVTHRRYETAQWGTIRWELITEAEKRYSR